MALRTDDGGGFLGRGEVAVDRDHACPLARVERRCRLAVPPAWARGARAEDESHAILEPAAHGSGDLAREFLQDRPGLLAELALPLVEETRLAQFLAEGLLVHGLELD